MSELLSFAAGAGALVFLEICVLIKFQGAIIEKLQASESRPPTSEEILLKKPGAYEFPPNTPERPLTAEELREASAEGDKILANLRKRVGEISDEISENRRFNYLSDDKEPQG